MGIADYFQKVMQADLGRPMGQRLSVPQPYIPSIRAATPRTSDVVTGIRQGIIDLPSSIEKGYERVFGERATGGEGGGLMAKIMREAGKEQDIARGKENRRVAGLTKKILEKNRVDFAAQMEDMRAQEGEEAKNDLFEQYKKEGLSDVNAKWLADQQGESQGFSGWVDKNVGKYVSPVFNNPQNAVFGMLQQPQEETGGKPGYGDILPGMLRGLQYGITGHKQYDAGKIMEQYFPSAPHAAKVVGAGALTVTADPLNLFGAGALKYSREGKYLNDVGMAENVAEQVRKAATESGIDLGRYAASGSKIVSHETALDNIVKKVTSQVQSRVLDIKGGGAKGRLNVGSRKGFAAAAAADATNEARKGILGRFEDILDDYRKWVMDPANRGKVFDPVRMISMRAIDRHFDDFMRILNTKTGRITDKMLDDVAEQVRRNFDKGGEEFGQAVYRNVGQSYYNAPAIRVAGKYVKIPFLGKAMSSIQTSGRFNDMEAITSLSHAGQFPGKLALLQNRGRAHGVQLLEELREEVEKFATDYDKGQREAIMEMAEKPMGAFPHDPHLQSGLDFYRQKMDEIFDREAKSGVPGRSPDQKLDNYTFVWNRRGSPKRLREFKNGRRDQIWAKKGAANYNVAAAKLKKFNPVTDPFKQILLRQAKSNRDVTRALFISDLAENYGHVARGLPVDAAERQKLVKLNKEHLAEPLRDMAKGRGDEWYLPQSYHDAYDDFNELSKFNADYRPVRWLRKITNFIKASATVYNPGYHPRNMISDAVMGFLDGVGLKAWSTYLSKAGFYRKGIEKVPRFHLRSGAKFRIGENYVLSADEAQRLFKANSAGGGFAVGDVGGNIMSQVGSKINDRVRNISEVREDFGRMVHFMEALKQEYRGLRKSGLSQTAREAKAVEQAAWRVNHYKFDYGALTKWEQRVMKPAIPFYTFTRKAVPTLMESFITHPKWLLRYQRLREAADGDNAKNFMSYQLPDWMKETGFATIADEKEPLNFTFDTLPTDALASVIPPGKKNISNLAQTLVEQVNPLAQAPFELANRRQIFSGKKIDSPWEYMLDKIGGPLNAAEQFKTNWDRGRPFMENILSSRLGLGLPLHRVSREQMDFQAKQWEDKNIEAPRDKFNEGEGKKKGIRIVISKGSRPIDPSSYKVVDDNTGKTLWEGVDPWVAIQMAKRSKGSQLDTNLDDWNEGYTDDNDVFHRGVGDTHNLRIYYSERKDGNSYRVKDTKSDKILFESKDPQKALNFARGRAKHRPASYKRDKKERRSIMPYERVG
jgi:hypothetical protein